MEKTTTSSSAWTTSVITYATRIRTAKSRAGPTLEKKSNLLALRQMEMHRSQFSLQLMIMKNIESSNQKLLNQTNNNWLQDVKKKRYADKIRSLLNLDPSRVSTHHHLRKWVNFTLLKDLFLSPTSTQFLMNNTVNRIKMVNGKMVNFQPEIMLKQKQFLKSISKPLLSFPQNLSETSIGQMSWRKNHLRFSNRLKRKMKDPLMRRKSRTMMKKISSFWNWRAKSNLGRKKWTQLRRTMSNTKRARLNRMVRCRLNTIKSIKIIRLWSSKLMNWRPLWKMSKNQGPRRFQSSNCRWQRARTRELTFKINWRTWRNSRTILFNRKSCLIKR